MAHLAERLHGRGADPLRRAVGALQRREPRLYGRIARAQRIVFGIADLGCVLPVVERIVAGDLGGQALQLGLRLRFGERADRLGGRACFHAGKIASAEARIPSLREG